MKRREYHEIFPKKDLESPRSIQETNRSIRYTNESQKGVDFRNQLHYEKNRDKSSSLRRYMILFYE